jgi:hypothetical protein
VKALDDDVNERCCDVLNSTKNGIEECICFHFYTAG